MLRQKTHKQSFIRFKRWSRMGYAVFAGIHKVISIGTLSKTISEKALKKAKSITSTILFYNNELFNLVDSDIELEFLSNEIQLKAISTTAISNVNCHREIITLHHTKLFPTSDCFS